MIRKGIYHITSPPLGEMLWPTHSLLIADVVAIREHQTVSGLIYFNRAYHELWHGA